MWIPLMSGIINAVFILDLIVTLSTGDDLAHLLLDASGNTVASAITENMVFVCAIECLLIYIAFYSDISKCREAVR